MLFREFMDDYSIYHILGLGNENPKGTLIDEFNRGASPEYFIREVLKHSKPNTSAEAVLLAWNSLHDYIPDERWEQIANLRKQGYRVYLLSNTNIAHWYDTITRYGEQMERYFDDIFLSFELKCAKPDEQIYKEVDREIEADPERTIFVDDSLTNREAAEQYVQWTTCWDMKSLMQTIEIENIAKEILKQ